MTMLIGGCGTNFSGNYSSPSYTLTVYTEQAGGYGAWPNASVSGYADPATVSCTSSNPPDPQCYTNIPPNAKANTSGEYQFGTDALPGWWQVAAAADSNCPYGGSTSGQIGTEQPLYIVCGASNAGTAVATPATCVSGACPATITLTVSSPVSLPTTHALAVTDYNDAATETGASSPTATNSVSVAVPTPTAVGNTVLVITDPATNQVLGAVLFVVTPPTTAEPSSSSSYYTSGFPPTIEFTITAYDSTPGAQIYWQIDSCSGNGWGSNPVSSGGSFGLEYQSQYNCNPSGTMYAQAPGYAPSASVPIGFE
jgi:hypothetical protein